jgi:hypothetical protein
MNFAILIDGCWTGTQRSVLAVFGDGQDEEYSLNWPRAGATRGGHAFARETAHDAPRDAERLWPTPAACLPNEAEEPAQWLRRFVRNAFRSDGATRAGVPLAVAARSPLVLSIAKISRLDEIRAVLEQHEREPISELASRDTLNPVWVERLMGFPEGWSDPS